MKSGEDTILRFGGNREGTKSLAEEMIRRVTSGLWGYHLRCDDGVQS